MDTYPPEFVIHLQPTLIVTGLTSTDNASDSSHQDQKPFNDSPPPPPPRPGAQGSPSALEFQKSTLLQAMLSRNNVSYWDNTKGLAGSLFYVISEQRSYVLPPTRKFLQQTNQQHLVPSLSPSSSSSPLYPDGLISPVFVKRHREQIPSVFIAIVDLWDRESTGLPNEGGHQRNFSDKGPLGVIDPMERERDIVLAQELLERRKAAQERSVKFATVILLQRSHMEDPAIEDRLNFVRKSAGLDNKNSFYVLPPSTAQEINDFAVNLQRSQYEGSMNYYKEQVKRHKKKKSILPATSASIRPVQQQNTGIQQSALQHQGLSVQGWMLRYEFKMGMFSECKQDIDNAVKHYESAYGLLIDMFAVTSTITPGASGLQARTRRWAEAKVLADCLCLKICKFHLYLDAPSTALFHFRRHLLVFKAFSESWRMGDDSFEYWAWLGKQYRVFGDLLDIGTKSGFKLPVPTPGSVVYGSFAGMSEGSKDLNKFSGIGLGGGTAGFGIGPGGDAYAYGGSVGGGRGGGTHGPGAGINPMLVLQHAGFFYHQAANCSVQRRLHFEMAEEAFPDSTVAPTPSASKPYPPSLQSMNAERGIDHLALTIELLTKSYEQFKRHKSGRMTLFLASEIAGTYYTAGKFEMALKFFERIGKTYRKEGWNLILTSILKWSIQCAKELGYWENVVEYLFEMLSSDMPSTEAKRQSIFDELVSILYTDIHPANTVPHSPLVLSMPYINSFVSCAIQFQHRQAFVSSESKFQVQLSTSSGSGALPQPFRISFVQVEFSDPSLNHRFEDLRPYSQAEGEDETRALKNTKVINMKDRTGRNIEWNDCSKCELETIGSSPDSEPISAEGESHSQSVWKAGVKLDIRPFETKVLEGVIIPKKEQIVKVVKLVLGIATEHWNVALEFPSLESLQELDPSGLQAQQQQQLPNQDAPPRRKWLDVIDDSTKLVFRNLDKGVRQPTVLTIVPRESKVEIKTLFKSPAYLDEYFPVVIRVKNGETCAVQMEMDVDLQSIDATIESLDSILLDPHTMANAPASSKDAHTTQSLRGIKLTCRQSSDSDDTSHGVPVGMWAEQIIYIRALEIPTPRTVVCKVRYEISTGVDGQNVEKRTLTEKLHSFRVLFIPPFDAEVNYVPQSNISTDKDTTGDLVPILEPNNVDPALGSVLIPALTHKEQYLMSTRVNNEGPWPVQVKEVKLVIGSAMDALLGMEARLAGMDSKDSSSTEPRAHHLGRSHSISRARERKRMLHESGVHVDVVDENREPGVQSKNGIQEWRSGNLVTFNHLIEVVAADLELAPEQIEVGFLHVKWRRFDENSAENNIPFTETNVPLQPLSLPKAEVYMTVDLPNYAQVNKPFTARYTIQNPTGRMHELTMTVEPSEGMVYAGTMQTTVKILPYASHPIQMNCYPLNAGLVRLPRLKLVVNKRKPLGRRVNLKGPQQGQGQGQGQEGVQGHVIVKIKGARTSSRSGSDSVVIFVKPEAGTIE
ncbi:hypothetical protein BGZ81_000063 [Podila clonocystis]|nr:hypothetical protein BGZ81_000063 [Podila clonocystis]